MKVIKNPCYGHTKSTWGLGERHQRLSDEKKMLQ
jgi:hypothetical protein